MSIEFWARRPAGRNLIGALLMGLSWLALHAVGNGLTDELGGGLLTAPLLMVAELLGATLLTVALYDRMPAASVGLGVHRWMLREWGTGILLGLLTASLASAPALMFGEIRPGGGDLSFLAYLAAYILLAAAFEELIFRGYLYQRLVELCGVTAATLLASAGFALAHLGAPQMTPLALVNLVLGGVFFSVCWIRTGSLWLPIALHATWNLALAGLFGLPVSGRDLGSGLLLTSPAGPEWLTGGSFGPEGGIGATAALLAGLYLIAGTSLVRYSPYTYATLFHAVRRKREPIGRRGGSSL